MFPEDIIQRNIYSGYKNIDKLASYKKHVNQGSKRTLVAHRFTVYFGTTNNALKLINCGVNPLTCFMKNMMTSTSLEIVLLKSHFNG